MLSSESRALEDPLTGERIDSHDALLQSAQAHIAHVAVRNTVEMAQRIARAVESERTHRYRFDSVNVGLMRAVREGITTSGDETTPPERALATLHEHVVEGDEAVRLHRLLGHKGIGMTLGYVEQVGDWSAVRKLDAEFRAFPKSDLLAERGFEFAETYGQKQDAHLSYGLKLDRSVNGTNLIGIRKRAAADVSADGIDYDIIKRSAFLLNPSKMTQEQLVLAGVVLHARHGDTESPDYQEKELEFGQEIIEKAVTDEGDIRRSGLIFPVASAYVALHRFD